MLFLMWCKLASYSQYAFEDPKVVAHNSESHILISGIRAKLILFCEDVGKARKHN